MASPRGVALQLGTNYIIPDLFIDNGLLAGGDYPIQATIADAPTAAPVIDSRLTVFGEAGEQQVQELVREREAVLKEDEAAKNEGKEGPKPTTEEEEAFEKPEAFLNPFLSAADGLPWAVGIDDHGGILRGRQGGSGALGHA